MEPGCRAARAAALGTMLVLMPLLLPASMFLPTARGLTPHNPIFIDGDSNFTAANGVIGGSGTPSDPYIIDGWDIDASAGIGIEIRGTTAYFVIRNVSSHDGYAMPPPCYEGIKLTNVANGVLENVTLSNNLRALDIVYATNLVITRSHIQGNPTWGISISDSNRLVVTGNEFDGSGGQHFSCEDCSGLSITANQFRGWDVRTGGIDLVGGTNNVTISGNSFTWAGIYIRDASESDYDSYTITPDNFINRKPVLFYRDCDGLDLDGVTAGEVIVANCRNVRIANLDINDTDAGIELGHVEDVIVTGNRLTGLTYGLWVEGDVHRLNVTGNTVSASLLGIAFFAIPPAITSVTVEGNALSGGGIGMDFMGVSNFTVARNTIERTGLQSVQQVGIWVYGFTEDARILWNSITGQNASHAWEIPYNLGIHVWRASNTTVAGNSVSWNPGGGIRVEGSTDTLVYGNEVWNNGNDSRHLADGIEVITSPSTAIVGNNVSANGRGIEIASWDSVQLRNCLQGNGIQAIDGGGSQNRWDDGYPNGGNFWSDYSGSDQFYGPGQNLSGPDGIGDVPYVIDADSLDRYPSMRCQFGNTPPRASFTVTPPSGDTWTSFSVDSSATWDFETPSALEYRWDWEDDALWDTPWSSAKVATNTYSSPGTYTIRLEVRDPGGLMNETTRQVLVRAPADYVPVSPQPSGSTVIGLSLPVVFSAQVTNAGDTSAGAETTLAFLNESVPGIPFAEFPVLPLSPFSVSAPFSAIWFSPAVPGTYRVLADVDYYDDLAELNESNNRHVWTVVVVAAPMTSLVVGNPNYTSISMYVRSTTPLDLSARDQSGLGIRNTTYTIDGGNPVNYTRMGTFFLTGEGVHTIEWRSLDWAGNLEQNNSITLIVDDTPPATALSIGEPKHLIGGRYVKSSTPLSLSAVDGGIGLNSTPYSNTTVYRLWGGSWSNWRTYTPPFTLTGRDGTWFVEFFSRDLLFNFESVRNETLILDDSPPATAILPAIGSYSIDTVFTLTATDSGCGVNVTKYRIDGGNRVVYSGGFTLSEGIHNISYYSNDMLNNTEKERWLVVTVTGQPPPNTPPSVDLLAPTGGEDWLAGSVHPVNWTMHDDQDVKEDLTVYINYTTGGTTASMSAALKGGDSFLWTLPDIEADDVVVNVTVIDRGGLKGWDQSGPFSIRAPTEPSEAAVNYKPVVALIFTIILLVVGAWSSKRRPWKGGKESMTALKALMITSLPFVLAEILTGVVSYTTGELRIPPYVSVGTAVDSIILIAGLAITIFRASMSGTSNAELTDESKNH